METVREIEALNELLKTAQSYSHKLIRMEVDWVRLSTNHPSGVDDNVQVKPKITIVYE